MPSRFETNAYVNNITTFAHFVQSQLYELNKFTGLYSALSKHSWSMNTQYKWILKMIFLVFNECLYSIVGSSTIG